jgi:arginase
MPGTTLTVFRSRTADRNPRAMRGAVAVGARLAARLGLPIQYCGEFEEPLGADWKTELEAARPALQRLGRTLHQILSEDRVALTTLGRCASSIATLPVVARHRSDALIVWFDAHGDSNLPETTATPYLGGMVLTGASGRWNTGLGADLDMRNVVLVGSRDLDPDERELVASGVLTLVPPGPNLADELGELISDRPVYIHLDCDVLDPGIVPTEYRVPGGLSLMDLERAAARLARNRLIGLEIAEFESEWVENGRPGEPDRIVNTLWPLLGPLQAS